MALMATFPIPFGTQSNPGRHGMDTGARLINVMGEPAEDGKSSSALYMFDGLEDFATLTDGGRYRGGLVFNNQLYVVSGTGLYRVDTSGTATIVGGIPGTSPVTMTRNQDQITIVAEGGAAYLFEGGTLSLVTDADVGAPVSVTTINRRAVYAEATGRIAYSDVENAGVIDTAAFFEAEADPDGLVGAFEHKLDLWAFGTSTTEVFRDTGAETDPFRRLGAPIEKGCLALGSIATIGEYIVWVGNDNVVYASTGSGYEALSHPPIGRDIAALTDKTELRAKAYYWRDKPMYELSAPSFTWVLNLGTKRWVESESYGLTRRRTEGAVDFGGMTIFGDVSLPKLYKLTAGAQDEAGSRFVGLLRSEPVHAFPDQIIIDRLDLDFETGVGLNSLNNEESDPQIGLRVSDDGGFTWSNQRTASLGTIGSRRVRVEFNSLGMTGRVGRIFELEMSAPVVRAFYGAKAHGRTVRG